MRIIYFQDFHIAGRNSQNRLGNYFDSCMLKLDEILQIAIENKCDFILDGGDLTETANPAYMVLDAIADRSEKCGIPFYSLFGNHNQLCGHIENSQNTGLAHLQKRSKLFKRFTEYSNDDIHIIGIDYEFGMEEKLVNNPLLNFTDKNSWNVAIIHGMITPTKFFENVSYITPEQIQTNADLILCAHYHTPWKKKIGKTEFVDIGCMGRYNINEHEIKPSVLILDTNNRSYEVIPLKSARPGNEIFDITKYQALKNQKKDIKEFLTSLKNTQFQKMSIGEQITYIGKQNKVDEKIINYILDKMVNIKGDNDV